VFTHHYLRAKNQQPVAWGDAAHERLREVSAPPCASAMTPP